MPIHKNSPRKARVTLTFSGVYNRTDSDWAASEVTQDWFSVTEATVAADPNTAVKIITFLDDENDATAPRISAGGNTLVLPWVSQDGADNRDVRTASQTAIVVHGWLDSFDSTVNVEVTGGTDLDFVGKFDWSVAGSEVTGIQKGLVGTLLEDVHPINTTITPFFLNTGREFTGDQGANFYDSSRNTVTFEIAATGGSSVLFNRGDILGTGNGFVPGARVSTEIDIRFDDTFPISGDRTIFEIDGFAEGDLGTGVAENDTALRFIFIGGTSGLDNDGARLEIFFGNSGDTTLIQWIDGIVDIITNNAGTRSGGADQSVLSYTASRVGVDTLRLTAKAGIFWPAFPNTINTTTGYLSTVTNQEFSEFSVSCATDTISGAVMTWVSGADVEQVSSVPADILFVEAAGGSGASNVGVVLEDVGYTHVVDSSAQSGTITLNSGTWVDLGFSEATEVISGVTVLVNESFFQFGEIAKTNEVGVPAWTGRVTAVFSSGADSLVQLAVQTGSAALTASTGTDGTLVDSDILDRLFVQQSPDIRLGVLDGILAGDFNVNGYTLEGDCTEADWYGEVTAGDIVQTGVDFIDVNYDPSAFTLVGGQGVNIESFNTGELNPADTSQIQLRLQNDSQTGYWGNTAGRTQLFGQTVDSGGRPFATNWDEWADLLLVAINTPADAPFSVPSITNNNFWPFTASKLNVTATTGTIRITPKAGVLWSNISYTTTNNQAGFVDIDVSSTTVTGGTKLSLEDDANRVGGRTGIRLVNENYVSKTTNYDLPYVDFARGSTLTLRAGFLLTIGRGYDWVGDAKDCTLTIEDNSHLKFIAQARGNLWGGKFRILPGGGEGMPVRSTVDHPMTIILRNGGQITLNLEGGLLAPIFGQRTILMASRRNNSVIFDVDSGSVGFYNSNGNTFYGPPPGAKRDLTITYNSPTGTSIYEPDRTNKLFTGDRLIIGSNNNGLTLNGSDSPVDAARTFAYSGQWVTIGMEFQGFSGTLGAYQPRNMHFVLIDTTTSDGIYTGQWSFNQRLTNGDGTRHVGIGVMGRLWNSSWDYKLSPLTQVNASYYYEDETETSLITVKECSESGNIGTVGTQGHPFKNTTEISSTLGLADVSTTTDNSYISNIGALDTDSEKQALIDANTGWGNLEDPRNGIALTFTKGDEVSTTDGGTFSTLTSVPKTKWFGYIRRNGFRPYFVRRDFDGSLADYQTNFSLDPLLDPYWQANTIAEIDAFADAIVEGNMLVNASLRFIVSTSGANNWNDIYREIEFRENKGNISDGSISFETRAYDSVNNLNGRFRRLIDTDSPVSSGSLMRIIQGDTYMTINTAVGISTDNNAISGIDCGTQNLTIASVSGVSRDMTGNLKTTGDIILSARNLGTSLVWKNSEFNSDSLQITSLAGIGNSVNNHLDNCVLNVNTLTFGGSAADEAGTVHLESTASDYAVDNSTINVVNALTFKDTVNKTIINITNALTFEDTVDDSTVNTNSNVSLNENTSENRIGLTDSRAGAVDYNNSTGTSTTDIVHCTSLILPKTTIGGTFDSTGTVTSATLANTCNTSNITGSVIILGAIDKCNIDGLSNTVTLDAVTETTITNASDVTVEGLDQGSNVTATGTFISTGDVSESTIIAEIVIINTAATSFTGDIGIATVTTSATILTLGD